MHLAISMTPSPSREGGSLLTLKAASYSTDSAGTLHVYRMRDYVQGDQGPAKTFKEEFLTIPVQKYDMVVAADTKDALWSLVSLVRDGTSRAS